MFDFHKLKNEILNLLPRFACTRTLHFERVEIVEINN